MYTMTRKGNTPNAPLLQTLSFYLDSQSIEGSPLLCLQARRSALEAMSRGEVRGKSYSAPLPLVRMPDNELPASSAAVLLLSQQATLLRTVYGAVRLAREEQGEGSTQV